MLNNPTLAERFSEPKADDEWIHPGRLLEGVLWLKSSEESLMRSLGWFSIGLGLTEILAPQALGRLIGAGSYSRYLPLFGVREIASGIGILRNERPAGWLLSRVVGDAMDIAFLTAASNSSRADSNRLAAAAAAVAGVAALDVLESLRQSGR